MWRSAPNSNQDKSFSSTFFYLTLIRKAMTSLPETTVRKTLPTAETATTTTTTSKNSESGRRTPATAGPPRFESGYSGRSSLSFQLSFEKKWKEKCQKMMNLPFNRQRCLIAPRVKLFYCKLGWKWVSMNTSLWFKL